mgnify:CR=1 FL=1
MADIYIYDAVRTPRGRGRAPRGEKPGGAFSGVHPQELLAQTLHRLAEKSDLDKALVDDAAVGCVTQVGEPRACVARNAVLAAGWPQPVTGTTVNGFR